MQRTGLSVTALAALLVAAAAVADSPSATTIIVVRHAEKADDSRDPELSAAGQARARALAGVLADAGLDAAYASQYRRTQSTAAPAARQAGLEVLVDPIEGEIEAWAGGFAGRLRDRHAGQTVLVAGHSNTVPALVAALCACAVAPLEDSDYDRIYIVQIDGATADLIRARYGAP